MNGHGYLELTGIEAFVGGYITLGSRLFHKVTDNMMVTAPVGTGRENQISEPINRNGG